LKYCIFFGNHVPISITICITYNFLIQMIFLKWWNVHFKCLYHLHVKWTFNPVACAIYHQLKHILWLNKGANIYQFLCETYLLLNN
jgi:hypothetical protein